MDENIDGLYLALSLLIPGCIAAGASIYIGKKGNKKKSIKEVFTLDLHSLYKQGWFITAGIAGLLYTIVFMGWSVFCLDFDMSAKGFEVFITQSQLALGILSAASLLLLLISRLHASHQTEKQIKETQKKNDFEIKLIKKDHFIKKINSSLVNCNKDLGIVSSEDLINTSVTDMITNYIDNEYYIMDSFSNEFNTKTQEADSNLISALESKGNKERLEYLENFESIFYEMTSLIGGRHALKDNMEIIYSSQRIFPKKISKNLGIVVQKSELLWNISYILELNTKQKGKVNKGLGKARLINQTVIRYRISKQKEIEGEINSLIQRIKEDESAKIIFSL